MVGSTRIMLVRLTHIILMWLLGVLGCASPATSSHGQEQVQYLISDSGEWIAAPETMSYEVRVERTDFGEGTDLKNQTWFEWRHDGKRFRVLKNDFAKAALKDLLQRAVDEGHLVTLRVDAGRLTWAQTRWLTIR